MRYVGDPVAVVIAEDLGIAEDAAELIDIEYEELPRAATVEAALTENAPLIHDTHDAISNFYFKGGAKPVANSNIFHTFLSETGDVVAAEAAATYLHEDHFKFPPIFHYALEPHTVIADFQGDSLTVWAGAQAPSAVQKVL